MSASVHRFFLVCLFVAVLLPMEPELAGMRLDPYRLVAISALIVLGPTYLVDATLKRRLPDVLILIFALWIVLVLVYHHGAERLPYAALLAFELMGGYVIGRSCVRTLDDFRFLNKLALSTILFLLPFGLVEMLTETSPIRDALRAIAPVKQPFFAEREGLTRAQTVFPHSILFGFYCTIFFAGALYLARRSLIRMGLAASAVTVATLTALSSAAILSIGVQIGLIAWGWLTRGKWKLLALMTAAIILFLEVASNRGPVILLIETLTLNPRTAWWRVHIFNYGMQSVTNNPLLGIGLNDWVRPFWLTHSVDNFWLLNAMRYGIPGFVLLASTFAAVFWSAARVQNLSEDAAAARQAYLIALTALILVLCTVHIWDSLMVVAMVFLAAGKVFETVPATDDQQTTANAGKLPVREQAAAYDGVTIAREGVSYTRFGNEKKRT